MKPNVRIPYFTWRMLWYYRYRLRTHLFLCITLPTLYPVLRNITLTYGAFLNNESYFKRNLIEIKSWLQ